MQIGLNNDIDFQGERYHIQTEDLGLKTNLIVSQIFRGGQIVETIQVSYAKHIEGIQNPDERDEMIRKRVRALHKLCYKNITNGKYLSPSSTIPDALNLVESNPELLARLHPAPDEQTEAKETDAEPSPPQPEETADTLSDSPPLLTGIPETQRPEIPPSTEALSVVTQSDQTTPAEKPLLLETDQPEEVSFAEEPGPQEPQEPEPSVDREPVLLETSPPEEVSLEEEPAPEKDQPPGKDQPSESGVSQQASPEPSIQQEVVPHQDATSQQPEEFHELHAMLDQPLVEFSEETPPPGTTSDLLPLSLPSEETPGVPPEIAPFLAEPHEGDEQESLDKTIVQTVRSLAAIIPEPKRAFCGLDCSPDRELARDIEAFLANL
ncbi:MAG: hypothetical protein JW797_01260 [Bradymonadales bacterium]|nr:hypothetical protein [Bradymonadales bacterium]